MRGTSYWRDRPFQRLLLRGRLLAGYARYWKIDALRLWAENDRSGAIEQDSDLILFVYREEMYAKEKTPQEAKGIAEIIIGKNRSGPMRDVKLAFLSQFTRFEDLAQDLE